MYFGKIIPKVAICKMEEEEETKGEENRSLFNCLGKIYYVTIEKWWQK